MWPFLSLIVINSAIEEGTEKRHLPILKYFILQNMLCWVWWPIPVILVTKETGTGDSLARSHLTLKWGFRKTAPWVKPLASQVWGPGFESPEPCGKQIYSSGISTWSSTRSCGEVGGTVRSPELSSQWACLRGAGTEGPLTTVHRDTRAPMFTRTAQVNDSVWKHVSRAMTL